MGKFFRKVVGRCRDQNGLTMVELIVAVGIISVAGALVAAPMFSVLRVNEDWQNDLSATANWRQAQGYLSRDAGKALTISLGDASPSVDAITMSWLGEGTETIDVVYELVDETLLRKQNGQGLAVARRVADVAFTRDESLLIMELTMKNASGPIWAKAALRSLEE